MGCNGKPQVIRCDNGPAYISSAIQKRRLNGALGWNTSSWATHSKMLMLSGSTGRYGRSGCYSSIGMTWQKSRTLRRCGCGLTTMTDPIWPWADLHQSSDWVWQRNVSTSVTPAKGDDYPAWQRSTFITQMDGTTVIYNILKKRYSNFF